MRNPNHYGSVVKLSGNRRKPFMVRSGVYDYDDRGYPKFHIIGYCETREQGNILLAQYNNDPWNVDQAKITLKQLFELWKENKSGKLGKSNFSSLCSAFRHCEGLSNRPYRQIKAFQMQYCIDNCGKGYSTQAAIKNLWGHLDRFALELDIISKTYSELLTSAPIPPTNRTPFTKEEIKTLWEHQGEPWVDTILILIYSGWRITEFLALKPEDIDLEAGTMKGGIKTKAGKGRVVPIHSKIRPLIETRFSEGGAWLMMYEGKHLSESKYREFWGGMMDGFGFEHNGHTPTPHECRHTFESLLDSAGGNRKCIDMLMGHVSKDVGNRVYNHKTLDELKSTVELITT